MSAGEIQKLPAGLPFSWGRDKCEVQRRPCDAARNPVQRTFFCTIRKNTEVVGFGVSRGHLVPACVLLILKFGGSPRQKVTSSVAEARAFVSFPIPVGDLEGLLLCYIEEVPVSAICKSVCSSGPPRLAVRYPGMSCALQRNR